MELLKKIKFSHILLVVLIYMGINIGLKIHELRTIVYGNKTEVTLELVDTFQFDDKLFEFYNDGTIKVNGIKVDGQKGYYNSDKTRHIYIEKREKRTIKQNGEVLEPIFKLESNKFKNIYIYEFDLNANIIGKPIDEKDDYVMTTSIFDNKNTNFIEEENVNVDLDKLHSLINTWDELSYSESLNIKSGSNVSSILSISNNWHKYAFEHCNFSPLHSYITLAQEDGYYVRVSFDNSIGTYYKLSETQYNELIELIKSSSI